MWCVSFSWETLSNKFSFLWHFLPVLACNYFKKLKSPLDDFNISLDTELKSHVHGQFYIFLKQ
jgi:hypothetical protein